MKKEEKAWEGLNFEMFLIDDTDPSSKMFDKYMKKAWIKRVATVKKEIKENMYEKSKRSLRCCRK